MNVNVDFLLRINCNKLFLIVFLIVYRSFDEFFKMGNFKDFKYKRI